MSQNISIVDYCYQRKDDLKKFQDYLKASTELYEIPSRFPKKRTASFKRRCPPRKKRILYQTRNETLCSTEVKLNRHRKRRNLLPLYKRYSFGQDETRYLETHLWHTKRTKIKSLWGCKIPLHSSQRGLHCSNIFISHTIH